jgi:hypothetical protein
MPDPGTGITVVTVLAVVAKQAQDFIAAVTGHHGESVGTILGNYTKRRQENAEAIGSRAHLTLLNIGVKAQEIPMSILMPALEAASLEEEPSLQEVWANLLANAADPREIVAVDPAFIHILKELSPKDAAILNRLYDNLIVARSITNADAVHMIPLFPADSGNELLYAYVELGFSRRSVNELGSWELAQGYVDVDAGIVRSVREERHLCGAIRDNLLRLRLIEQQALEQPIWPRADVRDAVAGWTSKHG